MDPDNITPDTLPVNGGEGAVVDVQTPDGVDTSSTATPKEDALTLSELNSILGKQFPNKEVALKALKDTQSYVGKKTEDAARELKEKGFLTREELENELFFRDNPDHANYKDTLEAIAKTKGISLKEAANSEGYKNLFEGASKYEEAKKMKSVLESSPRLRQAVEKADSIKQLKQSGNYEAAQAEAAKLIAEAYGLE
jgi:hypothetical protein